ncbi:MAG: GNAT family N-acetyltransferase [Betaproteobacteria bacterium]|jgi:putative hemolysin|nr:GNAT family N-acetyltransferase [Betaproteobacteria bacterium]
MLQQAPHARASRRPGLRVTLARSKTEILEAQRLRYRIFAEEMGARLPSREPGVDQDIYDPFCEHLIVRDESADRVVGTYRILAPEAARRIGGYYSETEFDLTRLQLLRGGMVEIGRSCIDPEYRTGGTIALLWGGLARYMAQGNYRYLIGCASISMADGGHAAANLCSRLGDHLAPVEYRVFPRHPLPVDRLYTGQPAEMPPLIKGYLRAGAWVGGDPAWDPDFNTADLLIMMSMARVDQRYARHFVERQAA